MAAGVTAIEQADSLEGVEHRLVDLGAEIDAGFEVVFAVEVEAGDVAGPEMGFVVGLVVEDDAGGDAGREVDFVVGRVVEVDVGDDVEFGVEEAEVVVEILMKTVLSKFVDGVEDARLQHTWTDSQ